MSMCSNCNMPFKWIRQPSSTWMFGQKTKTQFTFNSGCKLTRVQFLRSKVLSFVSFPTFSISLWSILRLFVRSRVCKFERKWKDWNATRPTFSRFDRFKLINSVQLQAISFTTTWSMPCNKKERCENKSTQNERARSTNSAIWQIDCPQASKKASNSRGIWPRQIFRCTQRKQSKIPKRCHGIECFIAPPIGLVKFEFP